MQTTFFFLFSVLVIERYEDFQNLLDFENLQNFICIILNGIIKLANPEKTRKKCRSVHSGSKEVKRREFGTKDTPVKG